MGLFLALALTGLNTSTVRTTVARKRDAQRHSHRTSRQAVAA